MDKRELIAIEAANFSSPPKTPNPLRDNQGYTERFGQGHGLVSRRSISPPAFQPQPQTHHNHRSISQQLQFPFSPSSTSNQNQSKIDTFSNYQIHSSLSISNAPSRNSLVEPNVFVTNPSNSNNHRKKFKKLINDSGREREEFGSLLHRLDVSIKTNFGDWKLDDDEDFNPRTKTITADHNNYKFNFNKEKRKNIICTNNTIDKCNISNDDDYLMGRNGKTQFPHIFKSYHNVTQSDYNTNTNNLRISSKDNDKTNSYYSKDNQDPNSILAEAKRTLNQLSN